MKQMTSKNVSFAQQRKLKNRRFTLTKMT